MPSRDQIQFRIAQRRQQAAAWYLKGDTQAAIAARLGVSRRTVRSDLKTVRESWLESSLRDFDMARAHELAKVQLIEREAWAAWDRSQQESVTTKVSQEEAENRSKQRAEKVSRGQTGDPRFLQTVLMCVLKRCKLLGLDRPATSASPEGAAPMDHSTLRVELLHEPAFLEYQRGRALEDDLQSGDVRAPSEPGPLADGPAPGLPGSDAHPHGGGEAGAADRADAAAAREE